MWPWKDLADRAGVFLTGLSKVCCLQLFDTAVEVKHALLTAKWLLTLVAPFF